jgi:hypothetical protein
MRRLEATCTAANTHTRFGVYVLTLEPLTRADLWPGTPLVRLETESGQSDPPMLTQRTGLGSSVPATEMPHFAV